MRGHQRVPLLVALALTLIFAFLASQGYQRHQEFARYHRLMAEQAATAAAGEIGYILQTYRRLALLFSHQQQEGLRKLLWDPKNAGISAELERALSAYIPEYADFALADGEGKLRYINRSSQLDQACRNQLIDFARNRGAEQSVKIHGEGHNSHFDVVTQFGEANQGGLFFVAISTQRLVQMLANNQPMGHALLLWRDDIQKPRLYPDDAPQLDQLRPALASRPVNGSPWRVTDQPQRNLYDHQLHSIAVETLLIFVVFAAITLLLVLLVRSDLRRADETASALSDIEDERRRIAMDLHDQVLGETTHWLRQSQGEELRNLDLDTLRQRCGDLIGSLRGIRDGIRSVIDDLHPQALEILGLEATLREALRRLLEPSGVQWSLELPGELEIRLSPAMRLNLYRIVLEAAQNVVRHSRARRFQITFVAMTDRLRLTFEDDGQGFNPRQLNDRGHGLANMNTRARSLGGELRWTSPPAGGALGRLELPLAAIESEPTYPEQGA